MQPLICSPAYPCWVEGLGFRVVEDTSTACAINDTVLGGKVTCASALGVLLIACEAEAQALPQMVAVPDVAPVPLPPSAILLLVAVGALFARPIWRAMGRLGDWFTAERGIGDGQNGWVG